jgi:hypothetical protein
LVPRSWTRCLIGFKIQNNDEIVAYCKRKGIWVVEDCAHYFNYYEERESGLAKPDFTFYSGHKFFLAKSGGILVNHSEFDLGNLDDCYNASADVLHCLLSFDVPKTIAK